MDDPLLWLYSFFAVLALGWGLRKALRLDRLDRQRLEAMTPEEMDEEQSRSAW